MVKISEMQNDLSESENRVEKSIFIKPQPSNG